MPLISIGIGKQRQSATAGTFIYPQILQNYAGFRCGDNFKRPNLTPTNAVALYDTAVADSGTVTMTGNSLRLNSNTTLNGEAGVSLQEFGIAIDNFAEELVTGAKINVIFNLPDVFSVENWFIGLGTTNTAPIAFTDKDNTGLWLFVNTAASNNFILADENNGGATTTDTGVSVLTHDSGASILKLEIDITTLTTGTVKLFAAAAQSEPFVQLGGTHTFTGFDSALNPLHLVFYNQTLNTSGKSLEIFEWYIDIKGN